MNSSHRQSTNVKLAAIIHSKADDEDEEFIRTMEKRAKQRLQRACLYGGGARYFIFFDTKVFLTIYSGQ